MGAALGPGEGSLKEGSGLKRRVTSLAIQRNTQPVKGAFTCGAYLQLEITGPGVPCLQKSTGRSRAVQKPPGEAGVSHLSGWVWGEMAGRGEGDVSPWLGRRRMGKSQMEANVRLSRSGRGTKVAASLWHALAAHALSPVPPGPSKRLSEQLAVVEATSPGRRKLSHFPWPFSWRS